jgi:hypothetical protein
MRPDEKQAEGRPTARGAPAALLVLAGFGAGLLGGFASRWLDGEPATASESRQAPDDAAAASQIAAEIRALTVAVTALAQRPAREAPASAIDSAPTPLSAGASDALSAAVASFAESVNRLSAQHPSTIERDNMLLPADPQAARRLVETLLQRDEVVVRKEHLLLSLRDVVERYGIPDVVNVYDNQAFELIYRVDEHGHAQIFSTHQGVVTNYQRK